MCACVAECRQVSIGYRVTGHLHGGGELDFGLLCRLSDSLQGHVVSGDVQSLLWCGWFIEREREEGEEEETKVGSREMEKKLDKGGKATV